ncbi:50S ribosomal protein L31 [Enterobacteriaceae endosymbiont of Macroplea mutica]|uniref:50S ribosomal protein L31 n=1 Tax=Enterobacteriaceae endosymbiont of Macroplea mutica TaxID=2675791 RepID=UPI0014496A89|nr:50S ribosomal protein L31 [Enterobacteriaceae endosymbiont of Macroplea mutica]QJC31399.1 50S ribosomal protein L31 [Enterobacteriaceae endosymbiont of Macroplea mutica]
MKQNIHPQYNNIIAQCSCGNIIHTKSTLNKKLHLDVCNMCHPFYTGKQKIIDIKGRVELFNRRFKNLTF